MSLTKSSPDPLREWHVLLHGERLGPYTLAALSDLLTTHPDGWAASVWRPGMLDWRPAQRVAALAHDTEPPASRAPAAPNATGPSSQSEARAATSRSRAEPHAATSDAEARPAKHVAAQRYDVATRTRTAPLMAETTHDMPAYSPPETSRGKLRGPARARNRGLRHVVATAGFVALCALLVAFFASRAQPRALRDSRAQPRALRDSRAQPRASMGSRAEPRAPSAAPVAVPREPIAPPQATPIAAPSPTSAEAQRLVSAPSAAAPAVPSPRLQTERGAEQPAARQRHVRVRVRWAPVRAAAAPDAKVLCSLPRGTELSTFGERPGTRARWFSVHCDGQTRGWLHENFLTFVRP